RGIWTKGIAELSNDIAVANNQAVCGAAFRRYRAEKLSEDDLLIGKIAGRRCGFMRFHEFDGGFQFCYSHSDVGRLPMFPVVPRRNVVARRMCGGNPSGRDERNEQN